MQTVNPEAADMLEALQATQYVMNDIENDTSPATVGGQNIDNEEVE